MEDGLEKFEVALSFGDRLPALPAGFIAPLVAQPLPQGRRTAVRAATLLALEFCGEEEVWTAEIWELRRTFPRRP